VLLEEAKASFERIKQRLRHILGQLLVFGVELCDMIMAR
jgi:hypothetical protein